MNSLIAFLLAALYVCLGYAVGVVMTRWGASRKPGDEPVRERETGDAPPSMTVEEASTFLERIQKVTTDVDKDVGRHANRVAEISGELSSHGAQNSAGVIAAAASLLEANRSLQQDLSEARAEIQSQRGQLEAYMEQALTDALTGLANRRGFDQELARRFAYLRRNGPTFSLVLVDVDYFKRFNDEHGHQAGDEVLSQVADVLTQSTRQMDFVARYGGEEFGVVLPGTTLEEAKTIAERIRASVERQTLPIRGRKLFVTVSAGVAEASRAEDPAALIERVDSALYAAKHAGRNLCQFHDGRNCVAIEWRDPALPDRANSTQRIAPFIDGRFPEPGMFREITCEDVSATAFSYVVGERPDYDTVLLSFGDGTEGAYTTASVKDCRNIGTDAAPLYRVTCRFTSPVDCFAAIDG